ncbi:MAG TPA: FtsQ-type POTRA domain-containing protein [Candidatus Omnitrophota bacterium]|nr:hypothetical protein [Candidatus Omnitrophota bacterium]HRK61138.1 FtsQ-type POTRA domain-containing protein [Candidatus Omnitrophota bacterium]
MAKRKNNVSTRKKFKWTSIYDWVPSALVQSFAWFVLVLFLVGSGLGVREMLYADPVLQLRQIKVYPPNAVSTAKLESLQKKYFGQNTAQIDLRAISKDLETDHQVLKAEVRRDLPYRLEIHVDRRVPFAYVQFGRSGKWAIVSRDAVVIDVVNQPAEGLYVVEDDLLANQKPKIGLRLTKDVMDLVRTMDAFLKHPAVQNEKVTGIEMLPNDAAIIRLSDLYLKVSLNDPDPAQAFSKFQYLLETETRAVIEYVDLRFNRVILKRKAEKTEKESKRR